MDLVVSPPTDGLRGTIKIAPDKSISHRALILGAIAKGTTRISGHLHSEDVNATLRALVSLGVSIDHDGQDVIVEGAGLKGLTRPAGPVDCANSGTTMRVLAGVLAGQSFDSVLVGDESLSQRPMARVIEPLQAMGAEISATAAGTAPLRVNGRPLRGVDHHLAVASAQVKSALLLAGLLATGTTSVTEPARSRDHTERMLSCFGARMESHGTTHSVEGGQQLDGRTVPVCADISSAAFMIVGALIVPDSELFLPGVGVNPTRTGALDVLDRMGACVSRRNESDMCGEPVADLTASSSSLEATRICGDIVPTLIDEIPILAVAATQAVGQTSITGASELRVKETDRIATLVAELRRLGAKIEERPDGMVIEGPSALRGTDCDSHGDHRIAMALAIAGLVADGETRVRGAECIDVSFPGFPQAIIQASGPVGS